MAQTAQPLSGLATGNPGFSRSEEVGFTEPMVESAVSWAAVIGGAVASISLTMMLLLLGAGFGLSMVSPWAGQGASAEAVGVSALIWIVIAQWLSSGLGGFLAGRLRTKWVHVHTHEVFFRDTAHGLLVWALATAAGAVVFAIITASGVSGATKGATEIASSAASGAAQEGVRSGQSGSEGQDYFIDTMYRSADPNRTSSGDFRAETVRILAGSTHQGQITLSADDRTYLAQSIATRTNISQQDAEQRVDNTVRHLNDASQAVRAAADVARKNLARLSIFTAIAMMIGAFIACTAGAIGGSLREEY